MAILSSSQITTQLNNWKVNELDAKISNSAPIIIPSTENDVLTALQVIIQNLNESTYNKIDGITIGNVTGLTAQLSSKENADPLILKQTHVVNNLVTNAANFPLSAAQGKILKDMIDALPNPNQIQVIAQGTSNETQASAIRGHLDNNSIHFTQAQIDHNVILNRGVNSHAQIDNHIADTTIHFTQAQIDHNNIANRGSNTHAQIDAHIANTTNPHGTTINQVVAAASLTPAKGHILVHNGANYISLPPGSNGLVLKANSSTPSGLEWSGDIGEVNTGSNLPGPGATIYAGKVGVDLTFKRVRSANAMISIGDNVDHILLTLNPNQIDHSQLANAGSNTHAQIDAHIANATIHRQINDSGTSTTELWSSSKINAELTAARNVDNHVNGTVNRVFTAALQNKLNAISTSSMVNTALTTLDVSALSGVNDFVISDTTNTSPWGFANKNELDTLIRVVKNLQDRVNELAIKLTGSM
ncbi:MAG: hypothetical protein NZZ41_02280 [Candidatus Dojkabacteria bacterium]|nr:hypothetical protein [Candidatus Dojkabacteria bacterium]